MFTSSGFQLIEVEPKSATIPKGDKLRLTCIADGYYEWCKFIHKDKYCDFEWRKSEWNITVKDCSLFEGRMRFVGEYDNYECIIELDNVTEDGRIKKCVDLQITSFICVPLHNFSITFLTF